jgi:DNA (cytosine-5)-methyltransferase 1
MMKVLDLFSGIGGFSLGLHNTGGFTTIAFCEQDEKCHAVLRKNFSKDIPILTDVMEAKYSQRYKALITKDGKHYINTDIDVICGGFPCQDISTANVGGKGLEGKRSGLWKEYARLIQEIKPRYAIIENVANLRTRGLATVVQDLWEIGYDCEWHVISACSIGAVHRRERIFIIAYPNSTKVRQLEQRQSQRRLPNGVQNEEEAKLRNDGEKIITPDSNDLRFWRTFASEKERREWRTETAARFRDVFGQVEKIEPTICGGDDGFPARLDKGRRQRIKQLGNAVVPQIIQLIGERILEYER